MMNIFSNGWLDDLSNHIILSQPKTVTEAENLAHLQNAVKCDSGVPSSLTASQDKDVLQKQKIKDLEGQGNLFMPIPPIQALKANMHIATKRQTKSFFLTPSPQYLQLVIFIH